MPVDHEKAVISQMLVELFSTIVNLRVQLAAMQAEIAALKAPPADDTAGTQ